MSDELTFNEVINRLETDTIGNYEMQEALENLRDIYAPTIEMTHKQYNYFKWLRDTNDSLFEAFLTVSDNENELSLFHELDLAQVWLHPETVEVVD